MAAETDHNPNLTQTMREIQLDAILQAIAEHGTQGKAAAALGISRRKVCYVLAEAKKRAKKSEI